MSAPTAPYRAVPSFWNRPTLFLLALAYDLKDSPLLSGTSPSCFFRGAQHLMQAILPVSCDYYCLSPLSTQLPCGRDSVNLVHRGVPHTEHFARHTTEVLNE